ncbi:MAG: hypothetical protein ACHP9Y_03785 [Gammaproteobacteria bacterium]
MSTENAVPAKSWVGTVRDAGGDAGSGVVASSVVFPAENFKRGAQSNTAIPLYQCYRGFLTSLIPAAPTLGVQTLGVHRHDSFSLAGAIIFSALLIGPIEALIYKQQIDPLGLKATMASVQKYGRYTLLRTFPFVLLREALFTESFANAKKQGKTLVEKYNSPLVGFSGQFFLVLSAAAIAHPFDTFATLFLKKLFNQPYYKKVTMLEVFLQQVKSSGIKSFYRGFGWQILAFPIPALAIANSDNLSQWLHSFCATQFKITHNTAAAAPSPTLKHENNRPNP